MKMEKRDPGMMRIAHPDRRRILKTAAVFSGALFSNACELFAGAARRLELAERPQRKLDLLVLGGTGFIGPHLVRHACERGHRVTIFTRGRRTADLPAEVVRLTGDRNGNLKSLEGKKWDAVVDDSATNPDWVRQSTALLKGNVGRYLFTSSTGVYYPYLKRGLDETASVRVDSDDPKDESAGVWCCQGEVRTAGAGGLWRSRRCRASNVHRGSRRHDRPLSLLAPASGSRR